MKPTNPSRLVRLALIALTLWLNACSLQSLGAPTPTPTPTAIPPTKTPEPTPTPKAIETPTPMDTPTPAETATATFEPTETKTPSEVDLKDVSTQTIHYEFSDSGAQIDVKLITDGSLDPVIRKVTVGEKSYAEFMARSIYSVWEKSHPGQSFETYMQMLAEVQKGERNPLDIAIPVYANDINDGVPYQNSDKSVNSAAQKKYLIIPWYKGNAAPKEVDGVEVRAVSEINIALVNGKKVKNISLFTEAGYIWGMGTNLDGDTLTFFSTITFIDSVPNRVRNTAAALSKFKVWMISNTGKSITSWPTSDNKLLELLMKEGGLAVQ